MVNQVIIELKIREAELQFYKVVQNKTVCQNKQKISRNCPFYIKNLKKRYKLNKYPVSFIISSFLLILLTVIRYIFINRTNSTNTLLILLLVL